MCCELFRAFIQEGFHQKVYVLVWLICSWIDERPCKCDCLKHPLRHYKPMVINSYLLTAHTIYATVHRIMFPNLDRKIYFWTPSGIYPIWNLPHKCYTWINNNQSQWMDLCSDGGDTSCNAKCLVWSSMRETVAYYPQFGTNMFIVKVVKIVFSSRGNWLIPNWVTWLSALLVNVHASTLCVLVCARVMCTFFSGILVIFRVCLFCF